MNSLIILAIDDIHDNLISLKALIYDIFPEASFLMALNGPKGLELARKESPDVILLDIVMPGMDGYEVCRQLKEDPQLKMIPVIFLTAMKTDSASRVSALDAGAEGFLSKPIDETELTAQIRAMAKIKAANVRKSFEKQQLAELVAQRTIELEKEYKSRQINEEKIRLLSRAIEQSPVCILITDSQGLIDYINPKFTDITGYLPEEVVGKSPNILKSGTHTSTFYQELWQTIKSGREWIGEIQNRKKDGKLYWEKATISPVVNEKEIITHFIAVKEDISEKKALFEELVLAKDKAEENNRLKTAFLQNISHEIRTPMNGILGFSELLKTPGLSGAEQLEFVNIIEQSGKRMLNLINDIVDISKIESGQMEIHIQDTSLNPILCDLLHFFRPEARSKGLLINLRCGLPDSEDAVSTDAAKLTQVLSNLINNAVKFTSQGKIEFGYLLKGNWLEFYVQDTGVGIPENQKSAIFESFIQGNMSLTRNFEGTGLGLSIAKAMIELLGGTIWFESEIGRGSDFWFRIPYNSTHATPLHHKKMSFDVSFDSITFLIVDDDPVGRMYLTTLLQGMGARILVAENGLEAIEWVISDPEIDLVLMDMKMPVMDGYEATSKIKNIRPSLPVIAQTAYAFSDEREKAMRAGCDDVITKPIQKFVLQEHVVMTLKRLASFK